MLRGIPSLKMEEEYLAKTTEQSKSRSILCSRIQGQRKK